MATHIGREALLHVNGNAVSEVSGWEITTTGGTVETSNINTLWDTHVATNKGWTFRGTVMWDETDTNGQQLLVEGAEVTVVGYPEGNASTDITYTGNTIITSRGHAVERNGVQMITIEGIGNGNLTRGAV